MFDEDEEPEAPPEVEYADLQRRFLLAAAAWIVGVAVLYVFGFLDLAFAIVVAVSGSVSALAVAFYWRRKLQQLTGR